MPASPKMRSVRFLLEGSTQTFTSPLSKSVQTLELLGSRWMASFELPAMKRANAAAWIAFLARLNGKAGRFYAGDPSATSPRGVATGTPLINGASQQGTSLVTDGWTALVTGILLAGDYIAYQVPSGNRQLHIIVADVNSDAGGSATLTIAPPIRESPADDEPLIISSPTCVMMLASDDGGAWDVDEAQIYGMRFTAEEAFSHAVVSQRKGTESLSMGLTESSDLVIT
jgi:hypothetical protein